MGDREGESGTGEVRSGSRNGGEERERPKEATSDDPERSERTADERSERTPSKRSVSPLPSEASILRGGTNDRPFERRRTRERTLAPHDSELSENPAGRGTKRRETCRGEPHEREDGENSLPMREARERSLLMRDDESPRKRRRLLSKETRPWEGMTSDFYPLTTIWQTSQRAAKSSGGRDDLRGSRMIATGL